MHYKLIAALLVCFCLPQAAIAQREPAPLPREVLLPDHLPGEDVALPQPSELRLVSNHGDTVVLQYAVTIPSMRVAQDRLSIYYRYTVGDETARVLHRETSTRWGLHLPIGADDIVTHPNLMPPKESKAGDFAGVDAAFYKERAFMRRPYPLAHGAVYQLQPTRPGEKIGAIYYVPREWREFEIDKEVILADEGFQDLGTHPHQNRFFLFSDRYVVLIKGDNTVARVLDVQANEVREIALSLPEGDRRSGPGVTAVDDTHLLARYGLYNLATGEREAVVAGRQRGEHEYSPHQFLRNGVRYGMMQEKPRPGGFGKETGKAQYKVWAMPALDDGKKLRVIATIDLEHYAERGRDRTAPFCFAGENGLVYTDGREWIEVDWLETEDFERDPEGGIQE